MVVGVLRLALVIRGARSLKEKRHALRRIIDRVRARYNVSIAEVGDNDIWQRALVGVTAVANDRSFVNEVLDKCARDAGNIAEIVNREMEIETYSEMSPDWSQKPDVDAHDLSAPPAAAEGEPAEEEEGWLTEEDLQK